MVWSAANGRTSSSRTDKDGVGAGQPHQLRDLSSSRPCASGLRCKEIWVVGADRYRNPDEDLPADFETQRVPPTTRRSGQPRDADTFISGLQKAMAAALGALNGRLPKNPTVRHPDRRQRRIVVSPLDAQPEPPNLPHLKAEIARRWPMTSLLDMLKEADLRVGFTRRLPQRRLARGPGPRRRCSGACCYACTAWAPTPGSSGSAAERAWRQLQGTALRAAALHHQDRLRDAIAAVVNAIFAPAIPHDLGRGHDRLRLRLQEVRRLGPEPA